MRGEASAIRSSRVPPPARMFQVTSRNSYVSRRNSRVSSTAFASPTRCTTTPSGNADINRLGAPRSSSTNTPLVRRAPDQPPERLAQPGASNPVIPALRIAVRQMHAPFAMQNIRARPRHFLEHHQPQRAARHIDAVAHRIRAEQATILLGAKNIDQRGVAHRIDVLCVKRDIPRLQFRRDPGMHRAQPVDRGEQSQYRRRPPRRITPETPTRVVRCRPAPDRSPPARGFAPRNRTARPPRPGSPATADAARRPAPRRRTRPARDRRCRRRAMSLK